MTRVVGLLATNWEWMHPRGSPKSPLAAKQILGEERSQIRPWVPRRATGGAKSLAPRNPELAAAFEQDWRRKKGYGNT